MPRIKMITLAFYLLESSPFLCSNLISCLLCNMNTLRNTLIIVSKNVEQDEMTC